MSILDKYSVRPIPKWEVEDWCLNKHYAKKLPSVIQYTFGCFNDSNILIGVSVFGLAGNKNLNKLGDYPIIELTRLVLNDNKEKNVTSYFVSQSLKMLPIKGFVVSFADANQHHHGYIYQATNWIYTGESAASEVYTNGITEMHSKTFSDRYGRRDKDFANKMGFDIITKKPKYRYFYIIASKKEKSKMKLLISSTFGILPYPKGDNERYDSSYAPALQSSLF